MKYTTLAIAGLLLAACNGIPGMQPASPPPPSPERMAAFVTMIEGAGCELDQEDNDMVLDPAGFGDAEASALSRQLIAEGRAEVTPEGNLALRTENCI